MDVICKTCGKSEAAARAGSITSYFFQHNFCRCHRKNEASDLKQTSNLGRQQVCLNCSKSRPHERKAGSFTAFLFKELRCQCVTPRFATTAQNRKFSSTSSSERYTKRRRLAKSIAAQLENAGTQTAIGPGTVIGGTFKIEKIIGEGGMGVVYLAQHLAMQQKFALKILSPGLSEQYWLRFQSEAKTLAALNHSSLVNVYDLGIHEKSVFYYSMDYLQGSNLEEILAEEGAQSLSYTTDIFLLVLDGLSYAHKHGIIHRDIKPANIFICSNDTNAPEVKILDFGISKSVTVGSEAQTLTAAGEVFGSPYYMSPEQCTGKAVDARSDIYSVGCSMFETLSGYVPFGGGSALEIGLLHEEELPPLISQVSKKQIPQAIEIVIDKCLAKLPDDRYQSARELALDLQRIKAGKNISALPSTARLEAIDSSAADKLTKNSIALAIITISAISAALAAGIAYFIFINTASEIAKPIKGSSSLGKDLDDAAVLNAKALENTEQDLDSDPDSAKVEAFLQSKPANYLKKSIVNGKIERSFYFPRDFSLGLLNFYPSGTPETRAQGKCIIPPEKSVALTASISVGKHPQLLNYFQNDDLISIELRAAGKNSSHFLPRLAKFTSLTHLRISEMIFLPEDVVYLDRMQSLTKLMIIAWTMDTEAIAKSKIWQHLDRLEISCNQSISPILERLSKCPNLIELCLQGCQFNRGDIVKLAGMHNLRKLSITSTLITNDDLEKLTTLKDLDFLNIARNTNLDAGCLVSIKKFSKLQRLVLPDQLIEDAYEKELYSELPSLKRID